MKRIILFISLILISNYCLMSCNKKEKKVAVQEMIVEKELPSFEENLDAFINNDIDAINKLKNGEIAPCKSVSSLIQYYLQEKDEKTCFRIVKLAIDNKGKLAYGMDFSNPLIESCKLNYYELTKYLLTMPVKKFINNPFSQYAPPLFWAMKNGNVELVELLLKNGADPNCETHYSRSYMDEIDAFIEKKLITLETADKMKTLLIQYGYEEGVINNHHF